MLPACLILVPLIFIIENHEPYQQINTQENINEIVDSQQIPSEEPGNWCTQLFSILWPVIFPQERIDQFKEQLQIIIDNNPVPYFEKIQLNKMVIGLTAPQITQISLPTGATAIPAEDSMIIELQGIYYPDFTLNGLLTPNATIPPFNISFRDMTLVMDVFIQVEFCSEELRPFIPFMTSIDFSLIKPVQLTGFNVTLFSSSNIINKDSLKAHMSDMFSKLVYNFCGMPNGFCWERVSNVWQMSRVFGSHSMNRLSLPEGECIRYNRIKEGANNLVKKLKIPYPLAIRTISHTNTETSTTNFELLMIEKEWDVDLISKLIENFTADPPSKQELTYFMGKSFVFINNWFSKWSTETLKEGKKKKGQAIGMDKNIEESLAPMYGYINFLNVQKTVNWEIADQLKLEYLVDTLEKKIITFHQKIFKLST